MNRSEAIENLRRARQQLLLAERELKRGEQPWRYLFSRYRMPLLLGGAALSGFTLARLSPTQWSRIGSTLFRGGAWLAQSPAGPLLFGAAVATIQARRTSGASAATTPGA